MLTDVVLKGVDEFVKSLESAQKDQVPFATMQTLNALAFQAREAWKVEAERSFDRPTPLTKNAALFKKATKTNLEAKVFVRDEAFKGNAPVKYLFAQVEGGDRRQKGFERWLAGVGILKQGQRAVPGRGAKLDQYGNIRGGELTKILSQLRASPDQYANQTDTSRARRRRRKARGGEYFAVTQQRGSLQPGVYERINFGFGSAVKSVLFFVDGARYQKRYNVYDVGTQIFNERYAAEFDVQLARALASAR